MTVTMVVPLGPAVVDLDAACVEVAERGSRPRLGGAVVSATALALRPYQCEAIGVVWAAWKRNVNRPAIVLPTGAGKTVVFSDLANQECERNGRVLILANREELVEQAAGKVAAIAPGIRVGIEMANRRADLFCDVVVASVPTLASAKRRQRWPRGHFTVVIVDEAHHALSDTYVAVMDYFGCYGTPGTRTLGVTATLARGDGAGLGTVWQEVAYERSLLEMITDPDGPYLVMPRGRRVEVGVDFSQVRSRGGDYMASDLGEALSDAGFETAVARAYTEYGEGRPGLVFTPTVATAHSAAQTLRDEGFKTEAVWGEMDSGARRRAIEGLRNGELDVLTNCAVLTEGTDIPRAAVAVMARPTKSGVLYRQMAGRVLRSFPGKSEALILDLVGSAADHRLCTLVDLADGEVKKQSKKKPEEEDPEEVLDGETLGEAVERIERRKLGTVKATAVDLFGASKANWLQTPGGHWFIPAPDGQVFLRKWDQGDGFFVGHAPREGEPEPIGQAPALDLAMAIGEEHVARLERGARGKPRGATSSRVAAWRNRAEPTDKQRKTAAGMGITIPARATPGQVSDLIAIKIATRIDRYFAERDRRRGAA